jgi:hypothetical protein
MRLTEKNKNLMGLIKENEIDKKAMQENIDIITKSNNEMREFILLIKERFNRKNSSSSIKFTN